MIRILVISIALVTFSAATVAADSITYRVRQGDSLELIAAELYGDRKHAALILVANRMPHPRRLKAGERLKIPVNGEVITLPGDTLESLAAAHLGDPRRGSFLAQWNGLDPGDSVAAGARLAIPLTVTHVAGTAGTLGGIAAAYLGDSRHAQLLQDYNFLDTGSVAKGASIVVPITSVHVRDSRLPALDAASRRRVDKLEQSRIVARTVLPRAYHAAEHGDWKLVKQELAALDLDFLDAPVAVEVGLLVGQAHLAAGDEPLALASFTHAIAREPGHILDPYYYSPTVRAAWRRAGGAATE